MYEMQSFVLYVDDILGIKLPFLRFKEVLQPVQLS